MPKKLTTEEFIEKAKAVHGDKYDYSKVEYVNSHTKVCIICPEHGEFWQTPSAHIYGESGCRMCSNEHVSEVQSDTIESFIEKARKKHGDKYDYSKVIYKNSSTKVCIICPIHGEFWQTPNNHLYGKGCEKCAHEYVASKKRISTDDFISRSIAIYGDKYNYSKVNYISNSKKVCIICSIHGEFWQRPSTHLLGNGCWKCGRSVTGDLLRNDLSSFVKKAFEKYGDKFSYKKSIYKSANSEIKITCPIHGDFITTPNAFLSQKHGCPQCAKEYVRKSNMMTTEHFIYEARKIHGDFYDYSLMKYVGCDDKVKIICPKHGIFEQTPYRHLRGAKCPNCESSHGETFIRKYLIDNDIKFVQQKNVCLPPKMFSRNKLRVDFYLPSYNTIIEFNGVQHYEYISFFHENEEDFQKQVERDKRLKEYCKDNKIKLIVIKYNQIDNINEILNKKLKL